MHSGPSNRALWPFGKSAIYRFFIKIGASCTQFWPQNSTHKAVFGWDLGDFARIFPGYSGQKREKRALYLRPI